MFVASHVRALSQHGDRQPRLCACARVQAAHGFVTHRCLCGDSLTRFIFVEG